MKYTVQTNLKKLISLRHKHTGVESSRPHRGLNRIVGGREAEANVWSFAVGIIGDGKYHCGGTILTSEWILTVSHCFSDL